MCHAVIVAEISPLSAPEPPHLDVLNRHKRGGRIHDANSWPVFSSGGSGIEELGIAVVRPTLDLFLKFEQLAGSAVRAACDPPVRSKKVQCFKNLLFRDIGLSGLATR